MAKGKERVGDDQNILIQTRESSVGETRKDEGGRGGEGGDGGGVVIIGGRVARDNAKDWTQLNLTDTLYATFQDLLSSTLTLDVSSETSDKKKTPTLSDYYTFHLLLLQHLLLCWRLISNPPTTINRDSYLVISAPYPFHSLDSSVSPSSPSLSHLCQGNWSTLHH